MTRLISLIFAALVATTVFTGCQANRTKSAAPTDIADTESSPNWPRLLDDFRFHWSTEPGTDITTGPAVAVRAYVESFGTATFTLSPDNVYPGFHRATPENQKLEGDFLWQMVQIRPLGEGYTKTTKDARPHFGYEADHLLELAPIPNGYRAIVCTGEYAHFLESTVKPGKFVSVGVNQETAQQYRPTDNGVYLRQIELTQHDPRVGTNPPTPVTAPQRGPAPAPDHDVFGNWFITAASSSHWGPRDDPKSLDFPPPDLQQRCEAAMPLDAAGRIAMMTGFKDQPPPHGQAIPGWPAKAQ